MVAAVRGGHSLRWVARQFRVSLLTVQGWFRRAKGLRLDRADWSDRPAGPQQAANRVPRKVEDLVLTTRRILREQALRRREPNAQPLLREIPYALRSRRFRE